VNSSLIPLTISFQADNHLFNLYVVVNPTIAKVVKKIQDKCEQRSIYRMSPIDNQLFAVFRAKVSIYIKYFESLDHNDLLRSL